MFVFLPPLARVSPYGRGFISTVEVFVCWVNDLPHLHWAQRSLWAEDVPPCVVNVRSPIFRGFFA